MFKIDNYVISVVCKSPLSSTVILKRFWLGERRIIPRWWSVISISSDEDLSALTAIKDNR